MEPVPADFCIEYEKLFLQCEQHEIDVRQLQEDLNKWNEMYRKHLLAAKEEGGPSPSGEQLIKKAFVAHFLRDNPKPIVPSLDTPAERRFHELNEQYAKHRLGIQAIQQKSQSPQEATTR